MMSRPAVLQVCLLAACLAWPSGGCRKAAPPAALVAPSVEADSEVDDLLQAMRRRLALMHDVARFKWTHKLPIHDPVREAALLTSLRERAPEARLDPELVARFFAGQIAAARLLQQADFDAWTAAGQPPFDEVADLSDVQRPRIEQATDELFEILARLRPRFDDPLFKLALTTQGPGVLQGDGIDETIRAAALSPLLDAGAVVGRE